MLVIERTTQKKCFLSKVLKGFGFFFLVIFELCSEDMMLVSFMKVLKHRDFILACICSETSGFTFY